jgi:hypothetical protein
MITKIIRKATDMGVGGEENFLKQEGFIGYRCYLIGLDGTIEQREELKAADDSAAAEAAQDVLKRSACLCAELWFLDRRISQLMKAVPC